MPSRIPWARNLRLPGLTCVGLLLSLMSGVAGSQRHDPRVGDRPEAEFHLARVIYRTNRRAGSHGYIQPMWAVDYPLADAHFLRTLERYTKVEVAEDSRHMELTDDRLFDYPYLWLQQPAAGGWNPTREDAQRLREYLLRGGFLMVDDFHGEYEWNYFESVMKRVFPEKQFKDVPADDPLMHIFFDIDQSVPIPGDRHLRFGGGPPAMQGPSHWRALYDDHDRLIVIANHNMDIGDGWEHADDPEYPLPYTKAAYELGVNYVVWAMSH
jgi:Domain of unknown function (DUF4159)